MLLASSPTGNAVDAPVPRWPMRNSISLYLHLCWYPGASACSHLTAFRRVIIVDCSIFLTIMLALPAFTTARRIIHPIANLVRVDFNVGAYRSTATTYALGPGL